MRSRSVICSFLVLAALVAGYLALRRPQPTWKRENPLTSSIAVASVQDGILTLADGRALRPAGVQPRPDVTSEQYDEFLRIASAQGVVVERMLDDGRAFVRVEPKYWNWCGTSQRDLLWAGSYFQAPVSELAIVEGYADPDAEQGGLSDWERWRLCAVEELRLFDEPTALIERHGALRYNSAGWLRAEDMDEFLEIVTDLPAPD